jgi:low affinity Fe/Cu permease
MSNLSGLFDRLAHRVAHASGRPGTFMLALGTVVVWAVSGPLFGFSETWQLVINTGTTIITFLMVFLVQATQNRDGEAIQAKLDELILVSSAENTLIGAEGLSEEELKRLRDIIKSNAEKVEGEIGRQVDERKRTGRSPTKPTTSVRRAATRGRQAKDKASDER